MHDDRFDYVDYDDIQRRVTERVQRRYRFFFHSAIFVVGLPIIGQWQSATLFLLWVTGWICHLLWVSYHHHLQRAIDEEIAYEQERLKRKRHAIDEARIPYDDYYHPDETEYDEQPASYPPDEHNGHARPAWLGDDGEFVRSDDWRG